MMRWGHNFVVSYLPSGKTTPMTQQAPLDQRLLKYANLTQWGDPCIDKLQEEGDSFIFWVCLTSAQIVATKSKQF